MTKKYFMDCGSCGTKIPVGVGQIVYKMYECPKCKELNYPWNKHLDYSEVESSEV